MKIKINFSKMHGNGNDFLVFNALNAPFDWDPTVLQKLAHRQFGVGADQILVVEKPTLAGCDFRYRIFNADGGEVEQCGNGARCFTRFVHDKKLTQQTRLSIETKAGVIHPEILPDGRVRVDMGAPKFGALAVELNEAKLLKKHNKSGSFLPQSVVFYPVSSFLSEEPHCLELLSDIFKGDEPALMCVSMGNPHAVIRVPDLFDLFRDPRADVLVRQVGSSLESNPLFQQRANIGFLRVKNRDQVDLRVYERGAGETLACGSGACAAVVAGIVSEWLSSEVEVQTRGGRLSVSWVLNVSPKNNQKYDEQQKNETLNNRTNELKALVSPVFLVGDAQLVFDFDGEIDL